MYGEEYDKNSVIKEKLDNSYFQDSKDISKLESCIKGKSLELLSIFNLIRMIFENDVGISQNQFQKDLVKSQKDKLNNKIN